MHFPRNRAIQRTRGASVREGKTQLSGLVRMAHAIRGMAMPEGTDPHGFSQKPGGVGNTARGDHLRKGCSGGMEGGAGGETQFPITHPPSPVWKTQLQTRQIDFRQAGREFSKHDTPGSGGLPFPSPALERAIPFETHSQPAGHSPALWQGNSRCLTLPAGRAGALPPTG